MNDIEKTIEQLKRDIDTIKSVYTGIALEKIKEHFMTCYMTAISALEKQIAKKPVFAGGRYNCQCGWDICRDKQPYCMMCGKAIDWEV